MHAGQSVHLLNDEHRSRCHNSRLDQIEEPAEVAALPVNTSEGADAAVAEAEGPIQFDPFLLRGLLRQRVLASLSVTGLLPFPRKTAVRDSLPRHGLSC